MLRASDSSCLPTGELSDEEDDEADAPGTCPAGAGDSADAGSDSDGSTDSA